MKKNNGTISDEVKAQVSPEQMKHIRSITEDESSITVVFAKPGAPQPEEAEKRQEEPKQPETPKYKTIIQMEYRYKPAKSAGNVEMERRTYPVNVEMRAKDGSVTISGYAAVYDEMSEEMFGFVERIAPGAFDDTDMSDVRALFNHDPNFVLGRTTNGTLKLETDERGLKYTITPPNTQTIRDLVIDPLKRGDISQSSFGFTISGDEWEEEEGQMPVRTITGVHTLYDVSPVTFPAYRQTDATARSMQEFRAKRKEQPALDTAEGENYEGPDSGVQEPAEERSIEWAEKKMVELRLKEL